MNKGPAKCPASDNALLLCHHFPFPCFLQTVLYFEKRFEFIIKN